MHAEEWRRPSVQWYTSNHTGFLCKDFYHESFLQYTVAIYNIRNMEVVYRYQQSRVFSGHDVRFVFCLCEKLCLVQITTQKQRYHRSALASHFPTPSLVRAVPSLCIALATSVVHDSENRRARSSDVEMAYFTRQANSSWGTSEIGTFRVNGFCPF